jgi:hypothetical protein
MVLSSTSLCALLATKSPKSALMDYKIEIVDKTGIIHLGPDCLSRLIPFEEKINRLDQDNDSQPAKIMWISETNQRYAIEY